MKNPPSWSSLRTLGDSRLLRSSYFWIAFVPVVVKFFGKINPIFTVPIGSRSYTLDLRLPFSWELFFYGALCTAIANLIYSFVCPTIVKTYSSFQDFSNKGKGSDQLRELFTELIAKYYKQFPGSDLHSLLQEYFVSYGVANVGDSTVENALDQVSATPRQAITVVESIEIQQSRIAGAFWFVRDWADSLRRGWRWICFVFYVLGLSLFVVVMIQNILFVIQYSLANL